MAYKFKLSILIASLSSRKKLRERLLMKLNPQLTKDVELLLYIDKGKISIGVKRQRMIEMAKGEYVVFVDDDDLISSDYIQVILNALKEKPDVVGIKLLHFINNNLHGESHHSLKYDVWSKKESITNIDLFKITKCPNHLNPVKKELALKVGYPDLRFKEDKAYSEDLYKYLKTEVDINNSPIYFIYERK